VGACCTRADLDARYSLSKVEEKLSMLERKLALLEAQVRALRRTSLGAGPACRLNPPRRVRCVWARGAQVKSLPP